MGTLFRSEEMQLVQLFVQTEAAHDTIEELGELGLIQFRDLNEDVNAFQRSFVEDVKRCDEMERQLRFVTEQAVKAGVYKEPENMRVLLNAESDTSLDDLGGKDGKLDVLERELLEMNKNEEDLHRNHSELAELKFVLEEDDAFFREDGAYDGGAFGAAGNVQGGNEQHQRLLEDYDLAGGRNQAGASSSLGYLTGVLNRTKIFDFERVLWRSTRGNMFLRVVPAPALLKDPSTGEDVAKVVFVVFFQGDRLQSKIRKICESFGANLYPCPPTRAERMELLAQVNNRLEDLDVVIQRTEEQRCNLLTNVSGYIEAWQAKVMKEKAVYHTMNMFNYDIGRKCLIAEGWCPKDATWEIQLALRRATDRSGALVPSILSVIQTSDDPPTYFKTNKFTSAFQNLIDAYGMASYGEVNPGVFSIITFPFLFGVMFGDVGHGFCIVMFAVVLIWKEEELGASKLDEMLGMMYGGRYMLLLMGLFSMYCGLIYNEFFGMPLRIWESQWVRGAVSGSATTGVRVHHNYTAGDASDGWYAGVYPFGVDYIWKSANNEIDFYNSFKMKTAILFGVTQMTFGIVLSGFNAYHLKHKFNWFEVIPQIIFLHSLFGYLSLLILLKWTTDWDAWGIKYGDGVLCPDKFGDLCAAAGGCQTVSADCKTCVDQDVWGCMGLTNCSGVPSLLVLMIHMFLNITSPDACEMIFFGSTAGGLAFQETLQKILVLVAVLMVPLMLLPKPFLLRWEHNKGYNVIVAAASEEELDEPAHEEEFDFSEVFVHQIIHTIEFVLGAVSNTASYLRLWALSLAHAELASVLWEQILVTMMELGAGSGAGPIMMFVGWAAWAAGTVAILLVMESLSAFLHALRLHWVEFMNKHYAGAGTKFMPFSFEAILLGEDED